MSETPLSDLITRVLRSSVARDTDRLHREFLAASVGIFVLRLPNAPAGAVIDAGGLELPIFRAPNGMRVIRVCADPEVFQARFGVVLNALITGDEALEMLRNGDPTIDGVLLASAASEHSILFTRADAEVLLATREAERARARPWWKRWS